MSELALASFDGMNLSGQLQRTADGATEAELHILAYLACLLAVFEDHPPGWWGYRFTSTKAGAPFAYALHEAIDASLPAGLLERDDRVFRLTARGQVELELLTPLPLNARRLRYLEAAGATALTMPMPSVADALSFEPGLRRALRYVRTRSLLDETGLALLEEQFAALSEALTEEEERDPLVPSVVWLTYLAQQRPADQEAA